MTNHIEPSDDEVFEGHFESTGDRGGALWPCAVIMMICALVVLGVCFAGVYLLINWPQS